MATSSGKVATLEMKFSAEQREAVGSHLQSQLVELIDPGLQAKQAHWNVVGPHFRSLHHELDEMVQAYWGWARSRRRPTARRCGWTGASCEVRSKEA